MAALQIKADNIYSDPKWTINSYISELERIKGKGYNWNKESPDSAGLS